MRQAAEGSTGSSQRFNYSVLGDNVNLASRLEGQSKVYAIDIVIGQNTYSHITDHAVIELDFVRVKGKKEPTRVFGLLGDPDFRTRTDFDALNKRHAMMLAAYRKQDWTTAMTLLKECIELDKPGAQLRFLYTLYRTRIDLYQTKPPGADWEGVTIAITK